MIRTARVYLLGKKTCNIPIFTQRVATIPKQIFVEFSIVADKEEESSIKQRQRILPKTHSKSKTSDSLEESYREMKYAFLRDIFSGDVLKTTGLFKRELALREFFNNLPEFTPSEIIKILKLLSETNNRPVESLKALCSILLSETNWQYTIKECADLLFALAKLSYREQKVIRLVAEQLKIFNDFYSPKTASYILYSLSDLKYKDCDLIEKLLKFVLACQSEVKISLNCLRAASLLNYQSPEVDQIIQSLQTLQEIDFAQSADYINFIWASTLLNRQNIIDMKHLSTVLSEEYVTRLLNNGVHASIKWKLLNINGAVKQMPSYKGPTLNNQSFFKIMALSIPNQRNSFMESVLDALSHVVPPTGQLKSLVNTGAGFYLDFDYLQSASKSPEPEAESDAKSRIGIMLLNFNDICSDGTLSGLAEFKLNILKGMGYKVVLIRYSEYNHNDPLSQKIEFLRNKIDSAVTDVSSYVCVRKQ